MTKQLHKQAQNTFVLQQDSSDCGVACLRSLIRYYGGDASLERLRELSGTTPQGTTLLGLYQAGPSLDLETEGCDADIAALIEHNQPTILHVQMEGNLEHYVVWYGPQEQKNDKYQTAKCKSVKIAGSAIFMVLRVPWNDSSYGSINRIL